MKDAMYVNVQTRAKFAKQYNFENILGEWHAFKVNKLVGLFFEVEYSKIDF